MRGRVLHLIDSLDLGGAQTVILGLAGQLREMGFSIDVACMHGRGVFTRDLEKLGISVASLSSAKFPPGYLWNLPLLLQDGKYDIVHTHLFGSNWIGKPLAAAIGMRNLVAHDHCNDRFRHERRSALFMDSLTNRLSSVIIGVSASTCDFLRKEEGLDPEKVRLIYNGVDAEEFQPATNEERAAAKQSFGWNPETLIIGGAGRFVPQKNFALWLEVASDLKLQFPEARFLLAGAGPEESQLREQVRASGLEGRVCFPGFVADRKLLYQAMDCLLITSDYEGLPMILLEGMAAGLPVVVSAVDGPSEILTSGENAILVPPGHRVGFVTEAAKLLGDSHVRELLGSQARKLVQERFSLQQQAASVAEIYSELLAVSH